ncbi:hypothetical protein V8C86DRAFT_1414378 [Haematococcus lacustris]
MILSGWLKKKSQSKSLLAKKYQKRWFELTDETLAYAKDPKELKEANIVVFSLLECQWVKRIDEIKLEMRFPERVLRVAAESPGQADKWLHAMERVLSKRGAAQGSAVQRSASSFTPEPVKRVGGQGFGKQQSVVLGVYLYNPECGHYCCQWDACNDGRATRHGVQFHFTPQHFG